MAVENPSSPPPRTLHGEAEASHVQQNGSVGKWSKSYIPISRSMQHVKVFSFNDEQSWEGQGIGHVSIEHLERLEDLGLTVIGEQHNDTLLVHRISSHDIYKRPKDVIICWEDPELATGLGLYFEEAESCSFIWDNICLVQRNLLFSSCRNESFQATKNELRELASIELSSLPLVLKSIQDCNAMEQLHVVELISQNQEFFPKLMELFRNFEDLKNMDGLHMIFKIIKGIILLDSELIFDKIFSDEFIMDIIGSLEYDPDVPQVQNHRAFLKRHVVFKEAIPIKNNSVLSKIHQTYRISYLKDVIFPSILDGATPASVNFIIDANNAVVVSLLKDDVCFIQELCARMRTSSISAESKGDLVLFLHEFCSLAKSLPAAETLQLFRNLMGGGLFDIITDVLQSQDKKLLSAGLNILFLFLDEDPNLLKLYVFEQKGNSLLEILVKGIIADFGQDVHIEFLEIMKILMSSYIISQSQKYTTIEIFYEKYLDQLIDVIASSCPPKNNSTIVAKPFAIGRRTQSCATAKPEILLSISELLCFCVIHHPNRISNYFLLNNAIEKVLYLVHRREKFLVVAAVRFMRTIISNNNELLLHQIVKGNLLKPVIEAFLENGNRYNMLHSGVLDLLEYIQKNNLRLLLKYIADNFWKQLLKFEHLRSIQSWIVKYEESMDNCDTSGTVTMVDIQERIGRRDHEGEDEENDNSDEESDEADSAKHVSCVRNQNDGASLSNVVKVDCTFLSARKLGHATGMDHDDHRPARHVPRPASTVDCNDEEITLAKKLKIDLNDCRVADASCGSTACNSYSQSKTLHIVGSDIMNRLGGSGDHNIEKEIEGHKSSTVYQNNGSSSGGN
ncbi:uncharacterized protein [Typha latifolia]|uniref:uncharacterized protein isoform X3 n=1 Tax=Typha latifolia TaxID=4733 RepID=UPI003C2CAC1D